MSRKLMVVMAAVALVAFMAAPSFAAGKIGFGGKAGLNVAKVTGDDADGAKTRLGFAVGAYADFPLSPNVSIHPEAMYWQAGSKYEEGDDEGTLKMDYIQVPVLVYFRVPSEGSKMTPAFFAGPTFGIKASSKISGTEDGVDYEGDIDNAKSMDVGICFGLGAEFAMSANKLSVEVRYTLGMTDLFDAVETPSGTEQSAKIKNGVISVLVGFGI